jgi:hypothetical protein
MGDKHLPIQRTKKYRIPKIGKKDLDSPFGKI